MITNVPIEGTEDGYFYMVDGLHDNERFIRYFANFANLCWKKRNTFYIFFNIIKFTKYFIKVRLLCPELKYRC